MANTKQALKELGKKCSTSSTTPTGDTISEVINSIAENFNITGAKGDTGPYVTAITLYTTEGTVTGGVGTLSNGNTVDITVTTTPAS